MKRIVAIITVLLLAVPSFANSWLDTRDDYAVAARVKLGLASSSAALSDTTASLLFNEAATLILSAKKIVRRVTSITTSYHQYMYALDTTLTGIEAVWVDSAGIIKTFSYMPISSWGQQQHSQTDNTDNNTLSKPSFYDYTDSLLLIYPTPAKPNSLADTLKVLGWHRIADIDTVATPTLIPEQYRIPILYHMVWNHAKSRGDPRTPEFKEELVWALSQVGLLLTPGGNVVEATK